MFGMDPIKLKSKNNIDAVVDYFCKYFENEQSPRGQFLGRGLEAFGVVPGEPIDRDKMKAVLTGFHPVSGEPLAGNAGPEHRPGWSASFSAPKTYSMLWALTPDEELRRDLESIHEEAVQEASEMALSFFQARRGKGGKELEDPRAILGMKFTHYTSRELDMQLHGHLLIANICQREDGAWGSLESRDVKRLQKAIGALYRVHLADKVQKLGFEVERAGDAFEIVGVDQNGLKELLSKRRKSIEETLEEAGVSGGKAAAIACKKTRKWKDEEQGKKAHLERWKMEAAEQGFEYAKIERKDSVEKKPMPGPGEFLQKLTENNATFTVAAFMSEVFKESQGRMSAAEARDYYEKLLRDPELVRVRDKRGQERFTTREMIEIEKGIIADAMSRKGEDKHKVSEAAIKTALKNRSLDPEQEAAFLHLVQGKDGVAFVQGKAGAGKSYMLGACREVWEKSGYRVRGCAIAGKAAEGLEADTGIKSETLDSVLLKLRYETIRLTAKDVIVIDEAGMVGSRKMRELQKYADAAGAKIVGVGDVKQCPPISAGHPMEDLIQDDRLGAAAMDNIRRQREIVTDAGEVIQRTGKTNVKKLNADARKKARAEGKLTGKQINFALEKGKLAVAVGERLFFQRESKKLGIDSETVGTVEAIGGWPWKQTLSVRLDDGRRVTFHAGEYNTIAYGYVREVTSKWQVEAVKNFSEGGAEKALLAFHKKGLLHVEESHDEAAAKMLRTWIAGGGVEEPEKHAMLAATRKDVRKLNELAREKLREAGKLGAEVAYRTKEYGVQKIAEGDRVMFRKRDKILGVLNGTTGRVRFVTSDGEAAKITVVLDNGREVTVKDSEYRDIHHSYACTIHKSQGMTIDYIYALIRGGNTSEEMAYVQMSRHKWACNIFMSADSPEGQEARENARMADATEAMRKYAADLVEKRGFEPPANSEFETLRNWLNSHSNKQIRSDKAGSGLSEELDALRELVDDPGRAGELAKTVKRMSTSGRKDGALDCEELPAAAPKPLVRALDPVQEEMSI